MPKHLPNYDEEIRDSGSPNALQELPEEIRTDSLQVSEENLEENLATKPYEVEITQKQYGAGNQDPVLKAFLSEDVREHGVRKLPTSQWDTLYEAFLGKERG